MDRIVHEKRLPHVSVVLPMSSTEDDAQEVAQELIQNALNLEHFEILHVEVIEKGHILTKGGMVEGKRYIVAFRQLHGETVYVHPDYDVVMDRGR